MGYRSDLYRIILSPYNLLACCAIFLVVRSEATEEHGDGNIRQAIEQKLLETLIDDSALIKYLNKCDFGNCDEYSKSSKPSDVTSFEEAKLREIGDQIQQGDSEITEKKGPENEAPVKQFESNFEDTFRKYSPIVDKIPDEICKKHSRLFLHHLRHYKMWALQMYDSSAKFPSGILRGNANQLGDFDQCLSLDVFEDRPGSDSKDHVTGKYCLAQLDVEAQSPLNGTESLAKAVYQTQSLAFLRSTVNDPGHFIPQFTSINWGVCLPASCSAADLQVVMGEALTVSGLRFNVRVDENMCYVKDVKPLSKYTYATIVGFGFFIAIALIASFRDLGPRKNTKEMSTLERTLACFSLQRNWALLVADPPESGDIHCIHGIRAGCTVMLYAAHKVIPLAMTPLSNRIMLTELSFEYLSMMLRASLIYTDAFLLMSGVLTAYNLSKEMQRSNRIDWANRYLARFIRLTPALCALVVFYAYILEHLGDGPLWNRVVKENADICKEHLWTNVLYIQNFFPFQQMCATHTHQLALDMQLSLLSPILVYLLYKRQTLGVILLLAMQAGTALLRFVVTFSNSLSLIIYHQMPVAQLYETANLSYSLSTHRAAPYLMGVAVGYFIYKNEKCIHIPKIAVVLGWTTAFLCAYLSVFAPIRVIREDFTYDPLGAAIYSSYSPITWSLALGWVITACALGHGGPLNRILSWKGMVFTSRISYSLYLTQFAVFFYNIGSLRSSQEFLLTRAVSLEEFLVVLLASIAMTLLFDLPMQDLKSIITGSGARARKLQ